MPHQLNGAMCSFSSAPQDEGEGGEETEHLVLVKVLLCRPCLVQLMWPWPDQNITLPKVLSLDWYDRAVLFKQVYLGSFMISSASRVWLALHELEVFNIQYNTMTPFSIVIGMHIFNSTVIYHNLSVLKSYKESPRPSGALPHLVANAAKQWPVHHMQCRLKLTCTFIIMQTDATAIGQDRHLQK
jgi:hypothetical protein